ncbi:MAG: helix-turn-helix transcriptional regulator [Phycisphaerae bacterium]|nr:helix-turn-helix transcriptional regulator [Gemmatimonadaceae bacterium]
MATVTLRDFELTVLTAVARLGDEAYGLRIQQDIATRHGRDYAVGAVYTTLQRLETKSLVSSRMTEPLAVRGGRARRVYKLKAAGRVALEAARERAQSIWTDLNLGTTSR